MKAPKERRQVVRSKYLVTILALALLILSLLAPPLLFADRQAFSAGSTFEQVWQTVNDNFFDSKFNGVDWQAMRQKYGTLAAQAKTEAEFASYINRMLDELKVSHTRFYTSSEPSYYQILGIFADRIPNLQKQLKPVFPGGKIAYSGIGIFTKVVDSKTFVSGILDGSPAASAGLLVGDRLLNVDGQPYHAIQSFASKVGQTVRLSIQRSPESGSYQEIVVTPRLFDATTMFLDAMKASVQIWERSGKKIGYVHIWSYAGDQYQQQLEEELIYGRLRDADGLILDLRDGWGGAVPEYLNIFNPKGLQLSYVSRNDRRRVNNSSWQKPVVMLVNEGSRSGKEILAFGFKRLHIGSLVGTKTAGAVVAGRAFLMADHSLLYLAVADVAINDERLEGKGVTPDFEVPFTLEYSQGVDPQQQKAVEVLQNHIQKNIQKK